MSNYKYFGVMLDCSRNAVVKVSAVKKWIDVLEKMGYNALELYTEDTFEVRDEPYFGYLRGRYRGAELREMDAYAAAHGIELIPCIQTLAHFTNPVKLRRFAEITDINDILLIDEEKTYEFIERMFASLAENFTSRNVNIGMDEAYMVGMGEYFHKHGLSDRLELLNRHLRRVVDIATKFGFRAHMWSDMIFRLATKGGYYSEGATIPAAFTENIPDVSLVYWDYIHTEESVYDAIMAQHKKLGREVWFAGGARKWTGFAPQTPLTYAAMKPAMKSVAKNGIKNVLITMWGDNGGECSSFAVLQVLYALRRYAGGEFDEKLIAADFEKLFGVSFFDFDLLALPDTVPFAKPVEQANPSKSLLYSDPFMGVFDTAAERRAKIPYGQYAQKLADAKQRAKEFAYVFDTAQKLCEMMELKAYLGVRTRKAYNAKDMSALNALVADYDETIARLKTFYDAFKRQWDAENKPFGFEVQCVRLGGVQKRLEYCRDRLCDFVAGKRDSIEELEAELLPLDPQNPDNLFCNHYRSLVSVSEL